MMEKLIAHTGRTQARFVSALLATFAALMVFSALAGAEATYVKSFGASGSGAGQFNEVAGISQNHTTGDVYVADRGNNRIQVFDEDGNFLEAWGFDVVASGVDDEPLVDEVQRITIKASAGTFTLTYGGNTTPALPFNATAAEVEAAVNGLASISSGGGSVDVTGGPGDPTGANPFVVTFNGGPLAKGDRETLTIDRSNLAVPFGTQISCKGTATHVVGGDGHFNYRWLRNGVPITGATSPTYTTTSDDDGKGIQCEVEVVYENFPPPVLSWDTVRDYTLVGSTPSAKIPLGPVSGVAEPSGPTIEAGGPGGTLTCNAGSWLNSPTSYTYQWYWKNGPLGDPVTTAATSVDLTVTEDMAAIRALFQCKVTGTNAAGSSVMWSDLRQTEPPPPTAGNFFFQEGDPVLAFPAGTSVVSTKTNGGVVFEVCKAGTNDVCKAGVAGPSLGQFSQPRGVAVDNSPGANGAVVVGDDYNYRVQKLSASGAPILAIGGGVDQLTGGNVCLVSSGHDCGAGYRAEDTTGGAFGGWPESTCCEVGWNEAGNSVAVDENNGKIYVTDPYDPPPFTPNPFKGRAQAFDSSGGFIGQVTLPGFLVPGDPISIGVDFEGRIGIANSDGSNSSAVEMFEPEEFTPEGTHRGLNERRQIDEGGVAMDLDGDPSSDKIYILDRNISHFEFAFGGTQHHVCGEKEDKTPRRALMVLDHEGHVLDCTVPQGLGAILSTAGVTISDNGFAYVTLHKQNVVKIFRVPDETAPTAGTSSVDRITQKSAQLHGLMNAGYEPTDWGFEYGTSPCSSSTCQKIAGGKVYGVTAKPVELSLPGLQPGTKYYFRVYGTNPLGGDVGPERTFITFPFVDLVNDKCGNALARKQTTAAGLLDCRAYELASAEFTGGYDVISDLAPDQVPLETSPDTPGKVLYAVKDGGIPGTGKPTNKGPDPYVAVRDAESAKWTTKYVGIPSDVTQTSAPFSSTPNDFGADLLTFAFGGPGICDPCFEEDGSSGLPVRLPDGRLVQGMTGSNPDPDAVQAGYVGDPMSASGTHLVFGTISQLEDAGNDNGDVTIYDRDLSAETTQVVSTDDNGDTLTGDGIGALDISADGSRIIVGQKFLPDDAKGNSRWQLYMHIGETAESVDLTPGTTTGALYAGMSDDGTQVFYSTRDKLSDDDDDTSADIYRVPVAGVGSASPELISVTDGGASNDDSCEPAGFPIGWNTVSGDGQCDAVPLAGGAGVAGDGTAYFLSPEVLAPGEGEAGAANLYVVRAGDDSPQFVATIDSTLGHAPPPAPKHPAVNENLITGLSTPQSLAVDQGNGDIYVLEKGSNSVSRYTATGTAKAFSGSPTPASNKLPGQVLEGGDGMGQIAVDASDSVMSGNLYVTEVAFEGKVRVYSNAGALLGQLGGFTVPCGVAVDDSTGTVYVADAVANKIWRFEPTSAPGPGVSNANYSVTSLATEGGFACQLAADTQGNVYGTMFGSSQVRQFDVSEFEPVASPREGVEIKDLGSVPPGHMVYVDPASDELYVDTGSKVVIFDSDGNKVKEFGAGRSGYGGIAVNGGEGAGQDARAHHAYAVDGSKVIEYGTEPDVYTPIDDPAVLHAVNDNEEHHWSDFQTTPDGRYALLSSIQGSLNPVYDNRNFRMVHRYDADEDELSCASCISTEGPPLGDASLPTRGLGLTNDGRVFFNSTDQLVMRDTNAKLDAYEWNEGAVGLISTGVSHAPSSMLSVTRDGVDAFFFTREVLVENDDNGETMKIYDARSSGGFFRLPQSPPCAASDECHGPGTEPAVTPAIGTYEGRGGNLKKTCKKGFVRRKGKCVRKHCKKGSVKRKGKCVKKKRAVSRKRGGRR